VLIEELRVLQLEVQQGGLLYVSDSLSLAVVSKLSTFGR